MSSKFKIGEKVYFVENPKYVTDGSSLFCEEVIGVTKRKMYDEKATFEYVIEVGLQNIRRKEGELFKTVEEARKEALKLSDNYIKELKERLSEAKEGRSRIITA